MADSAGKRILLVEDEAILAMTEKVQLEKYGYTVRTVATGEKAVEEVKTSSDIDLILMDINLGKGIDGTQAAEIILQDRDIPIVFLSSHTEPEIVEKTEKITSYGYVVKNSSITVLDASIKMAVKLFDAKQILNEKEKALSYKHEFMSYVIEHNRSAIAVHDKDLNYLYVSQQYLKSYRVVKNDIIGKHHYEIFPDLPQKWRDVHQKALRGEVSSAENDPFEREDGTTDWTRWECRPWYEQDGTIGGIIIYTEVITERKKAEDELRRFKTISDTAVYGNAIADLHGNLVYVNRFFANIHGYEPDELIGKHFALFHNERQIDTVNNLIASMMQEGVFKPANVWHCHKDGTEFPMLMSGVLLKDGNGNPQYIAASAVDTSSQTKAEERYRLLFHLSNDAIFVHEMGDDNRPSRNIEVNEQATRLLGYTREELLSMSAGDVVPEKHASAMHLHGQQLMERKHLTFETENIRSDGVVIPIEVSAHLHTEGNRKFVVSSVRDITERKRFETEIISQKQYLETILETTLDGFWVVTPDKKITRVNAAYCRMSGYSEDELTRMRINDLDVIESPQESAKRIEQILANGSEIFETKHRRKDGALFDVEVSVSRVDRSDGVYLACFFRDVTERKREQQQLTEKTSLLNDVLENMMDLIAITDLDGTFIYAGRSHESLGYSVGSLIGRNVLEYVHHDDLDSVTQEFSTFVQSETDSTVEYRYRCADGTYAWLETTGRILKDDKIMASRILFNTRDITERKNAEKEIRKQLAEKEILLREVHHRVKNNIANIESLLSLQAGSTANTEVKAALRVALSRVKSMRVLYDKLLLSNDLHGVSVKSYAEDLIDSLVMAFDPENNITIDKNIADFEVDPKKAFTIGIIINELLTNVFKYAFGDREDARVSVSIDKDEENATLIIQDNGAGFDERTLRNESPGFGLTIVKMLAEQLGGTYSTASHNGTKSVVRFANSPNSVALPKLP